MLAGPLLLALGPISVALSLPSGVQIEMLAGNPILDKAPGRTDQDGLRLRPDHWPDPGGHGRVLHGPPAQRLKDRLPDQLAMAS
ncbi:MAG: hypothetical protein C0524_09345 [Rhodobacter sp.]|nr:hypothetical protein [Rhodobacter sp.]